MQLVHHGGGCCGVRHIHDFGNGPDFVCPAIPAITTPTNSGFGLRMMTSAIPEEPAPGRLKRYVDAFDRTMKGILEVTLVAGKGLRGIEECPCEICHDARKNYVSPVEKWEPILFEHGFAVVSEFLNSNSNNIVRVYHRNTGILPIPVVENKEA